LETHRRRDFKERLWTNLRIDEEKSISSSGGKGRENIKGKAHGMISQLEELIKERLRVKED